MTAARLKTFRTRLAANTYSHRSTFDRVLPVYSVRRRRLFRPVSSLALHPSDINEEGGEITSKDQTRESSASTPNRRVAASPDERWLAAYRDRKRFSCATCGMHFARAQNLKSHLDSRPVWHSATTREPLSITAADVDDPRVFSSQELVLNQSCVHVTTMGSRSSIDSDARIRGSESLSPYDNERVERIPQVAYCRLFPKSDRILYPFTLFPRHVESGKRVRNLRVKLEFLSKGWQAGDFRLFHSQSTPTQFGKMSMRRYQTHVLVVERSYFDLFEDGKCSFVELHPKRNQVLHLDENNDFRIATRIAEPSGDVRRTQVTLLFVGGLDLSACEYSWHNATKLRSIVKGGSGFPRFICPKCDHLAQGMDSLKSHYLARHTRKR